MIFTIMARRPAPADLLRCSTMMTIPMMDGPERRDGAESMMDMIEASIISVEMRLLKGRERIPAADEASLQTNDRLLHWVREMRHKSKQGEVAGSNPVPEAGDHSGGRVA